MLQIFEAVIHLNVITKATDFFPAAFRACQLGAKEKW